MRFPIRDLAAAVGWFVCAFVCVILWVPYWWLALLGACCCAWYGGRHFGLWLAKVNEWSERPPHPSKIVADEWDLWLALLVLEDRRRRGR